VSAIVTFHTRVSLYLGLVVCASIGVAPHLTVVR
jgi:hypothetical protein